MSWTIARMARYVQKCKYLQQLKDNEDACNKAFEKGSYLLFCKDKPFVAQVATGNFLSVINWRSFKDVETFDPAVKQSSIVLDVNEEELTPLFAYSVSPDNEQYVQTNYSGSFIDMRRALFSLSEEENRLVSRGYSMITWNANTKFCSYCGSPLDRTTSGCSKVCSSKCKRMTVYPQIHPVAITRVVNHTQDKILLVRQPQHPKGMYTCVAGFMEPGEVLQDNVVREIAEETGVVVDKFSVKYFQSQAWPLPQASLMLGCTAVAVEGADQLEIQIDKAELEDAKWFTKEEASQAIKRIIENPKLLRENVNGDLIVPPNGAVAHQLILAFLDMYKPGKL